MITWTLFDPDIYTPLFDALEKGIWSATTTTLTFEHGTHTAVFHGTFSNGGLDGTISGFDAFDGAAKVLTTTGYTIGVPDFWTAEGKFVLAHDNTAALSQIFFGGPMTIYGSAGADLLASGRFENHLFGNGGDDLIIGSQFVNASDFLDGGSGADEMVGFGGDDIYVVDDAGDIVNEQYGTGTDSVRASISFSLADAVHAKGDIEILTLTGTADIDGTGNALANVLTGNGGSNTLDGLGGADTMRGGDGDDTYIVDNLGDIVDETAGSGLDTVRSSVAFSLSDAVHAKGDVENLVLTGATAIGATGSGLANTITGNGADNTLAGLAGKDVLNGGDGNDLLIGGLNKDTLTGGDGGDTFLFDTALGKNVDKITDFAGVADPVTHLSDIIEFDHDIFTGLDLGALKGKFFHAGSEAHDGNDRIIYDKQTGKLYFDADGTGGIDQIKVAKVFDHGSHHPHLDSSDFFVI